MIGTRERSTLDDAPGWTPVRQLVVPADTARVDAAGERDASFPAGLGCPAYAS